MTIFDFMSTNPWLTAFIVSCLTAAVCSIGECIAHIFKGKS